MARALVLALAVAGCVEGFTTPFMGRASGFLGRFSGQQQQQQVQQQPAFARQQKNGVMSMSSTEAPPKAAAVAASDPVAEYVKKHGGNKVIKKVLIANNGMAATKSMLSMRQWAYMEFGDEKAIEFVAMATPEDLKANAEFIKLADSFVEVPAGKNSNNYANVDVIVDIAKSKGVDAVWPGWGHASENPRLPDTLAENGIKFIGPNSKVMAALGDKIAANILAQTAGVASIPWSGDGLTAKLDETGAIPKETFDAAMVTTAEEAIASANRIGYPVMLKVRNELFIFLLGSS
jgi:acetyl-CoA carboxylase/biotin carboxylase 1